MSASQLLQHFLFTPETQYNYVARLSGGDMITDIQLAGAEELLARDERFRASLS